jgi:hypothetical protein
MKLIIPLLVLVVPALAAAQNTTSEWWPEIDVYYTPAAHQRTYLELSSSTEREGLGKERSVGLYQDYLIPAWGYWRAGYRYTSGVHGNPYREERGVFETQFRAATFGQLRLVNRTRAELRRVNDDYSYRARERVKLEHLPFSAMRTIWMPYVTAEAYYDSRYRTIARLGQRAGAEIGSPRVVAVDLYLARQENSRGRPTNIDALGVTVKVER